MKNVILVHFIIFFGSTQRPKLYLTCIPAPSSLSSYERPITKIAKPYSGENHFFQFQIHRADRVIFVPKKLTEPCILMAAIWILHGLVEPKVSWMTKQDKNERTLEGMRFSDFGASPAGVLQILDLEACFPSNSEVTESASILEIWIWAHISVVSRIWWTHVIYITKTQNAYEVASSGRNKVASDATETVHA